MKTGSEASSLIITTEYIFPAWFTPQSVVVPFRNILSKPTCENALQVRKATLQTPHRISSTLLPFTELWKEICKA